MEREKAKRLFVFGPATLLFVLGMWASTTHAQALPGGTLDPTTIPKYVTELVIPPVQSPVGRLKGATYYEIALRQFRQQVLPASLPETTVWGYGTVGSPESFHYPAFTVEARVNERVAVKWINDLVDAEGRYLPHLLPVDPTLHWANPPGPRDTRPSFNETPGPYEGPVPIVTHVHGAHVPAISDGYPEAWYLPDANNIPSGYFTQGTHYGSVIPSEAGTAVFEYTNDQEPTTLWYHDHTLGITRLNVYAGTAGFWILRGIHEKFLDLPGPAPSLGDPPGIIYHEIPIAIQDRSFNNDGSLFYPASREFFDGFSGPFIPESPIAPIWNPEFFGNTMVANGNTWPYLDVEPRKYRFRLLNGCNSRFIVLKLVRNPLAQRPVDAAVNFHQIGSDGGFLPEPVVLDRLLLGPAERADVVVDFTGFGVGDEIYLINEGPDEPFGGVVGESFADPATTGQVMKLRVVELSKPDNSSLPTSLAKVRRIPECSARQIRDLTLNEVMYSIGEEEYPVAALLGTGRDGPIMWNGMTELTGENVGITERPRLGTAEIWRLVNLTGDAHPIHVHLVQFQVLDRTPFDAQAYALAQQAYIQNGKVGAPPDPLDFSVGAPMVPRMEERGWKDTVIANPGQVTRIIQRFTKPGLYVWHCHILEHEDNEMMRPYEVVKGRRGSQTDGEELL